MADRCACGYLLPWHRGGQCPLCACGDMPAAHVPVMTPPAPVLALHYTVAQVCPTHPRSEAGQLLTLRRRAFRLPTPPAELTDWYGLLVPVKPEELAERVAQALTAAPPRVAMRAPHGPAELAPRAIRLGKMASDAGWFALPYYSVGGDGTEACSIRMRFESMRVVLLWKRAPGLFGGTKGWAADGAYAWCLGELPRKCSHTDVEVIFK